MQNGYDNNLASTTTNNTQTNQTTVIQTDVGAKDGQNKCPKCGATDISLNVSNSKLRCNFCRFEFDPVKLSNMQSDISELEGQIVGSGATDIIADTKDVITFKCSSCGAEVVIDTASATQARCHWCRNILSVNQQIPNGSIPDIVLPFGISKDIAKTQIEKFVSKRKFFANPKFKKEFTTENIMGVYFPYMLVDINSHVHLAGYGEHQTRKYYRGSGDRKRVYYDADLYAVERKFDLVIEGLTIESSLDKLSRSSDKTNNIINSIMPFDLENCVKYNANYLRGYTSEKRDVNIEQLRPIVETQAKDIARFSANSTLKNYDRGVAWSTEQLDIKGEQWKAAYLPVWLYSYQEVKGNKKILHYVAVNARTKETMGSVPIHMPMLLGISALIEFLSFGAVVLVDFEYDWVFLSFGFIYFFIMYAKYRNSNARHKYEKETKTEMDNLATIDNFVQSRTGLSSARMEGANNTFVSGQSIGSKFLDSLTQNSSLTNFINDDNQDGGKK